MKILETAKKLREDGIKCYILSDHSRYRADDLMDNVGLSKHFDGGFFSGYVGHTKSDSEFFKHILEKLNVNSSEVLYFDDDPQNMEVAKSVGLNAFFYENFEKFMSELQKLGINLK